MEIAQIIGDSRGFFLELVQDLSRVGILVDSLPLSHLCYRTATTSEYETIRELLKPQSRSFVENDFNGRPISMFLLRQSLQVSEARSVNLIELPAPKAAHPYPSGLEHAGFVVGPDLPNFNRKHEKVLSGLKDRGTDCQPSFITFADGRTAKFYDRPLLAIVQAQGWSFQG